MQRLKAIAEGKLFGVVDCYVLDGGVRVLSKRGVVRLLSSGLQSAEPRESEDFDSGHKSGSLGQFLGRLPSRYGNLAADTNIEFTLPGGRVGHAVDVKTVAAICRAYVESDLAGELRANQRHLARNAIRLQCAATEVGFEALVDEATGYEAVRARGDLAKLFRNSIGSWESTFSHQLVRELCRLGIAGSGNVGWHGGRYPQPLASAFRQIYELIIGVDAARAVKSRNPEPRHGRNHHQWLTEEARELLCRNMGIVTFCARTSTSRAEFWQSLKGHYRGQAFLVYGT